MLSRPKSLINELVENHLFTYNSALKVRMGDLVIRKVVIKLGFSLEAVRAALYDTKIFIFGQLKLRLKFDPLPKNCRRIRRFHGIGLVPKSYKPRLNDSV